MNQPANASTCLARLMGAGSRTAALVWMLVVWGTLAGGPASTAQTGPMPDFQLRDMNVASARYNQLVSPRDYRLQISAYYFGSAG